ncbi:polysulfide reductase NrfD [Roseomonas sp. NAR14]|uniref:Polysulfide reductase NrfD n=1 Tax=Roseomonas acroporae TaxID=2937791 RepID=A0A9X2BZW5_9PROT|nr:NrfD/PsrC family molybdoenzyme membrane anchor subunit [Roseomonas acroporae]MCK8787500.1 polysulfide reductase NrfD [Roseomonas acroporae]
MSLSTAPLARAALRRHGGTSYRLAVAAAAFGVVVLAWAVAVLLVRGIGVWGNNQPFVWGFDLIAYAWWIGVANAASLFAAVLVLRRHGLRTAVNRFAEAAALAAVLVASLYPVLHLGRPLLAHWVFPLPMTTGVWPYFGSTLVWDFWGIVSHLVVTSLFWFIGLIPDLATLRDRAAREGRLGVARAYGLFALGWRGSLAHWHRHQAAHRLVAALVLPLLLSAQTVVALEFVATPVPAWHQPRLPLQVLLTGLPAGLGVVLALAAVLRGGLGIERHIDDADMDLLARLLAAAGAGCAALYAYDALSGLVLGDAATRAAYAARLSHPAWWGGLALGALLPQLLWWRRLRLSARSVVPIGLLASAGVWLDRWSLVVDGLDRAGAAYRPSLNEWALLGGGLALFCLCLLLFARHVPVVSMFEIRHEENEREREEAEA